MHKFDLTYIQHYIHPFTLVYRITHVYSLRPKTQGGLFYMCNVNLWHEGNCYGYMKQLLLIHAELTNQPCTTGQYYLQGPEKKDTED